MRPFYDKIRKVERIKLKVVVAAAEVGKNLINVTEADDVSWLHCIPL